MTKPLDRADYAALILAAVCLFVAFGDRLPTLAVADFVAVVSETESGSLPPYVDAAIRELRSSGLRVRAVDRDVLSGDGSQPAELVAALEAAKTTGYPALIVMGGGKVISAQWLPGSQQAIVEAVR